MDSGWIKIYRQLTDSEIWKVRPFSKGQAWVDLIVLTNHTPGVVSVKNGQLLRIGRGECGWSASSLAKRWGWSRGKVNRFFGYLSDSEMIQQKIVENLTIIAICNYDKYQNGTTNDTTNSTTNGHQTVQQTDTNKNNKKNTLYRAPAHVRALAGLPEDVAAAFKKWMMNRSEIHGALTDFQIEANLEKILRMPEADRLDSINAAILGGWKTVVGKPEFNPSPATANAAPDLTRRGGRNYTTPEEKDFEETWNSDKKERWNEN